MCYLVTGINNSMNSSGARYFGLFDTEDEAKTAAETILEKDYSEVAVWKQIAVPKVERKINWELSS